MTQNKNVSCDKTSPRFHLFDGQGKIKSSLKLDENLWKKVMIEIWTIPRKRSTNINVQLKPTTVRPKQPLPIFSYFAMSKRSIKQVNVFPMNKTVNQTEPFHAKPACLWFCFYKHNQSINFEIT